ncbi:hypothetical protein Y032_0033g2773 [Ancylostoma ceylanicum]|uniref:Uncharacterized protein n=1 Tax=Ancylostoma ceylanicum TaxID=53326 RepID=A0A016UP18_9BILA|nr:hypothetical protein Y032_0033g2773 [Ancylostoma ceylanicum]
MDTSFTMHRATRLIGLDDRRMTLRVSYSKFKAFSCVVLQSGLNNRAHLFLCGVFVPIRFLPRSMLEIQV